MSNRHRWSKFWWQDWQNDKALNRCSLAARGLWMEMLCIAHEGEPYGHLRMNGQALLAADLADMINKTTEKEVVRLLAELEAKGVFSRTGADSVIMSRRMVKDAAQSEVAKEWGREGGNPALNGQEKPPKKSVGGLTPPLTPPLNHPPYPGPLTRGVKARLNGGVKLQEAEVESETEPEEELREDFYKLTSESPVSAREREDVPSPAAVEVSRREFSEDLTEATAPVAALIRGLAGSLRMKAYPPREPLRTRNEQVEIVGTKRRPKAFYLTREQINHQLQKKSA